MKTPVIAKTGKSVKETTLEQINRLIQDPKYAEIFKEMNIVWKKIGGIYSPRTRKM